MTHRHISKSAAVTTCDLNLAGFAVSIQAVQGCACYPGDVDWHIQGADDARVPVGQAVLDVVEGGVNENTSVVPGC